MNQPPYYRRYGPPSGQQPPIRTHLGWAVAALILCFWPAGLVAVVYAVRARARLGEGDYEAAARYARLAKIWSWLSLALAVVIVVMLVNEVSRAGTGTTTTVGLVLNAAFQSG